MNQEKIGKFITKKRKEKQLTQSELASRLFISDKTISKWERGRGIPDVSLFGNICNELDITVEELLSGEEKVKGNNETVNYLKYQKKLNIIKLVSVIIISLLVIGIILFFVFRPYHIEVKDTLNYSKMIYKFDDGRVLYSKYDNNYYIKNNKIDLKEALNNGTISIQKIIKDMEYVGGLNDGGTMIYKSKDSSFYLFDCHSIDFDDNGNMIRNNNYVITGNENDFDVCKYDKSKGIDTLCLNNKLGGYISNGDSNYYLVDARSITNGNIPSWEIYKNDNVGAYAIIRTDDEIVINDFKKYFNDIDSNYKYINIYEDYYIFIGNGFNDYNLRELNECIK